MSIVGRHHLKEAARTFGRVLLSRPFPFLNCGGFAPGPAQKVVVKHGIPNNRRCSMKIRSMSLTTLVLVGALAGSITVAALAATSTTDPARMEACFRAHGKLMSKPAVTNIYDCWRTHSYLMER